jgi:hypothetical protein
MSNIPVAFLVLGAFFFLYFVAALWGSKPVSTHAGRGRHPRQPLVARVKRALRWAIERE